MNNTLKLSIAAMVAGLAAACGQAASELDLAAHEAEVMEWRAGRLEQLVAPTGFLTQIGLYWLDEGTYVIGSEPGSDITLPPTAAGRVGTLVVADGQVRLRVEDGVEVTQNGEFVTDIRMPPDTSGENVMVEHGSVAWSIIERGGKLAARVRDFEHPWIRTFGPLPYYGIDPELRVEAVLHPYEEPREIVVNTVIEGFQQFPMAPGIVEFVIDGVTYELEPTLSGESLFFVFGDDTNRDETYGAGRYVYTEMPDEDGRLELDFNKSYSPPCAFNDFSTCTVASPRNRLPIRIEAGEKFDPALHYSLDVGH